MSEAFKTALQHQQAGRLAQAAEIFQALLRGNPQQPDVLHQYGLLHHQAGKPAEGLKFLQHAITLQPGRSDFLSNAATLLLASGKPAEAAAMADRALAAAPGNVHAANNLGLALSLLGRFDDAEAALRRAMAMQPDFPEARFNLGNLLRDRGDLPGAIAAYRDLLARVPQHVGAMVNLGVACELAGDLEAALAAYRAAAAEQPGLAIAQVNAGLALHKLHRHREAVEALRQALQLDPGSLAAQMALGQSARELGESETALTAFRAAAALAPDDGDVRAALSGLLSGLIPGWHFPMLADTARNDAFDAALKKAVTPDMTVLDIGTGSGLLALMAARAGAGRVVACEAHPLIAATARDIVARNGMGERITVIAKRSTELDPDTDLPGRADLVVAEVLDAGLIGEGMLPTSRDALKRLARPGARMIPSAAQVFAQVVHLPALRKVNPLRDIAGFDLSPFDRYRNQSAHGTVRLEHEIHSHLTAPLPVLRIDFAAPPDWTRPETMTWQAAATADGVAQAVVFWFELWLDAEIMVSTGPGGAMRHWGQAVCWLPEDRPVRTGETLAFRVTLADNYLDFTPA